MSGRTVGLHPHVEDVGGNLQDFTAGSAAIATISNALASVSVMSVPSGMFM